MAHSSRPWNRRDFIGAGLAGGAGLALGSRPGWAAPIGADDRIRIGVIGTGGRAGYLMKLLKARPGNAMVAVSDAYEPRMLEAAEIAGAGCARHPDYRQLLDDRSIDAVLIGAPDHWHLRMAAD